MSRTAKTGCILAVYGTLLAASQLWRIHSARPAPPPGVQFANLPAVDGLRTSRDFIRLAYRDSGPRDPSRSPVLLIHGSPGDGGAFDDLAPRLSARYRVLAPDLPGFGASSRDIPDYSNRAHAVYLIGLLDHLGIRSVHVAAQSMGGGVALHLANLAPSRVKSLTMISAVGVEEAELLGDHKLNHAIHGAQLAGLEFLRYGVPHFGLLDGLALDTSYARNFYDSDQSVYRKLLGGIECPTLIIHGRRDVLVPIQAAREHHRLVPQSELVELDHDHFFLFHHADRFAPAMAAFLDRVESGCATRRENAKPERLHEAALPFDPRSLPPLMGVALAVTLVLLASATLISEDLACVASGVLVAQHRLPFVAAAGACVIGIYVGDVLLYLAGRWLGRPLLSWAPVRKFVSEDAIGLASKWISERGSAVVLLSRFTPGLRLPTYLAAGMLNTSLTRFAALLLAADLVWTPMLVGLSAVLGREVLRYTEAGGAAVFWAVPLILGLIAAIRHVVAGVNAPHANTTSVAAESGSVRCWQPLADARGSADLRLKCGAFQHAGTLLRRAQEFRRRLRTWRGRLGWEFWPAWLAYIPVVVYVLVLGIRHRCLTLFTAANPGIPCGGGLAGESKSEILNGLAKAGAPVARYARIRGDLSPRVRQFGVLSFLRANKLSLPVVLKPDVGERGKGVRIVRSFQELMDYLESASGDIIVQEYVSGWEFGVFYYRFPGNTRGKILSITHKAFPSIVGDGKRTVEQLIRRDSRASIRAKAYLQTVGRGPGEIPAPGERIPLIEIGSHCRGAIFLDGSHLITPALEREFDRISANFPGFYFGRFDVRTRAIPAFRNGLGFSILELNGVSSEATHVYDPAISLFDAYRTLFAQWRIAFEIGAANRASGHRPLTLRELVELVRNHTARRPIVPVTRPATVHERPVSAASAA